MKVCRKFENGSANGKMDFNDRVPEIPAGRENGYVFSRKGNTMLIFLVGYMGCGKTSIGRQLAGKLNLRFLDMDAAIEQACGCSVREYFAANGEEAFRRLEREQVAALAEEKDAVVATGGGAPCFFDNMEVMNRAGVTVYFKMSPEKLAARLETGKAKRPLLKDKSEEELLEFIRKNVAEREPCYLKSRLIIGCDGVSDDYIANHVVLYVENRNKETNG